MFRLLKKLIENESLKKSLQRRIYKNFYLTNNYISEKIDRFGTSISKKSETFKIKKDDLFEDLKLKDYVKFIEETVECKVSIISVGPSREQSIHL